jgi:hypothetical protein
VTHTTGDISPLIYEQTLGVLTLRRKPGNSDAERIRAYIWESGLGLRLKDLGIEPEPIPLVAHGTSFDGCFCISLSMNVCESAMARLRMDVLHRPVDDRLFQCPFRPWHERSCSTATTAVPVRGRGAP